MARHPWRRWLAAAVLALLAGPCLALEDHMLLENGLEIVFEPDSTLPLVALVAVVRCGAALEKPGEAGMTHLLEHLLFDGAEGRPRDEIEPRIEAAGGYVNAFTRYDHTLFMILVPAGEAELACAVLADMLFRSVLPENQLDKERRVVLEEISRDREAPWSVAAETYRETLLGGTPYGRSLLGDEAVVAEIDREALADYYRSHYTTGNSLIVALGDFSPPDLRRLIRDRFGAVRPRPAPRAAAPIVELRAGRFWRALPASQGELRMAWPAPPAADPDEPAATLLAEILTARLGAAIEADAPVRAVSLSHESMRSLGAFHLAAEVDPERTPEAEQWLMEQLDSAGLAPFRPDELERARLGSRSERLLDGQRLDHRAWRIAAAWAAGGPGHLARFDAGLLRTAPADLERVAGAWLVPDSAFVLHLTPPGSVGPAAAAAAPLEPPREFPGPAGLPVVVRRNDASPQAAIEILIGERSRLEPEGRDGLTDLLLRALAAGPAGESTYAEQIGALGARLQVTDDPYLPFDDNYFSPAYAVVRLEGPAENFEQALELAGRMLAEPPAADGLAAAVSEVRRQQPVESAALAARQRAFSEWLPGDFRARRLLAPPAVLDSVTPEELREHARTVLCRRNLVAAAVGPGPEEELAAAVARELERLPDCRPNDLPPGRPAAAVRPAGRTLEIRGAWKRSHVLALLPLEPAAPERRAALDVGAGLIRDELVRTVREIDGMAYGIGCFVNEDGQPPLLEISIGTRPGNEEQVARRIREALALYRERPPATEAVAAGAADLAGLHLRSLMRRISQAHYLALSTYESGQPLAIDERHAALAGVAPGEVRSALRRSLPAAGDWIVIARGEPTPAAAGR